MTLLKETIRLKLFWDSSILYNRNDNLYFERVKNRGRLEDKFLILT